MENVDNKIKNIFQEKFRMPSPAFEDNEFDHIQLEVAKQKFFLFNFKSFNVFYAAAIAFIFLGTLAISVDYVLTKNTMERELKSLHAKVDHWNNLSNAKGNGEEIVEVRNEAVQAIEQIPVKPKRAQEDKSFKKTKKPVKEKRNSTTKVEQKPTSQKDSITISAPVVIDKKPKTVYIIKQDTIIRYDSVKVRRKQR